MSHIQNERYLEGANELFEECISSADHQGAKTVIAQLFRDGFEAEARDLEAQLLDQSLSKFVISLNVNHI